jgi:hypothetical protein
MWAICIHPSRSLERERKGACFSVFKIVKSEREAERERERRRIPVFLFISGRTALAQLTT